MAARHTAPSAPKRSCAPKAPTSAAATTASKAAAGTPKATVATGHKILTAAYHVLNQGVPYNELGEQFFYRRDTENTERYRRRLIRQLERLGHQVTLEPLPEAA